MDIIFYIGSAFIGMLAHFLKKKIKGQTFGEFKDWIGSHFKETVLAVIGTIVGLFVLNADSSLGFMSSFLAGYAADSALNKWDDKSFTKKEVK